MASRTAALVALLAVRGWADFGGDDEGLLAAGDECADDAGDCALSALQLRGGLQRRSLLGCHDTLPGEGCYLKIQWVLDVGLAKVPEKYPNLTAKSSMQDLQQAIHKTGGCPRPCTPSAVPWCQSATAPVLWAPSSEGGSLHVK
ncbi:unnamed protein product, partial [Polarella glacialis]